MRVPLPSPFPHLPSDIALAKQSASKRALCKLALFFCSLVLALPASAQTPDEILAKYFAARGGLDKIKAVQTEREVGTISFGPGLDGPFQVERARTLRLHMEVNLNGQLFVRTYDGKSSGWVYNSSLPNPSVQPMTDADLRSIFYEADFEGPFVDYKSKGNQLEFAGKDEVKGKPVYKIKLTNRDGEISFFSFDVSSGLLLRWQGNRKMGESKDSPWESFFSDYRDVSGLQYPFLIEFDSPGTEQIQVIRAERIEINVPIDESHFGKPNPLPLPSAPATSAAPATPAPQANPPVPANPPPN
jgi:hypothetical protein